MYQDTTAPDQAALQLCVLYLQLLGTLELDRRTLELEGQQKHIKSKAFVLTCFWACI